MTAGTAYDAAVPTSRDLMLTALHERISWFRGAPRLVAGAGSMAAEARRPRPRRHPLAHMGLSNRDHDELFLRPTMWVLFDL